MLDSVLDEKPSRPLQGGRGWVGGVIGKIGSVLKIPGRKGLWIRHSIMLGVLMLAGLGVFGGSLIKTFAFSDCTAPDQTYHVVWGDTLGGIAASFNTTVNTLANYNGIPNPNLILVGQRVCVPGKTTNTQTNYSASSTINTPTGSDQYVALARQFATEAGISPDIFVRQINQESGFNPNALSWAGAVGIAQFLPSTAAGLGVNPYDPVDSLRGAANLMASYVGQYGGYAQALAAYNAGPGNLQYAINAGGNNWRAFLPSETQSYLNIILG
jgi:hypothetical protein